MDRMHRGGDVEADATRAPLPVPASPTRPRFRRLVVSGGLATVGAVVTTTLLAAAASAAGVDFEVPAGGEAVPVPGIGVVTCFFSVVGVVIAAALLRWSRHPVERFRWTALSLTALSLVPPLSAGADTATTLTLLALHFAAAAVMIPALLRALRAGATR